MANPFNRAWRYLLALINGNLDKWENPEIILNEAVREMKENQIKNRELAVQAITQKNNLQAEVDKEERLVAEYERKATLALQSGNRELAKAIFEREGAARPDADEHAHEPELPPPKPPKKSRSRSSRKKSGFACALPRRWRSKPI